MATLLSATVIVNAEGQTLSPTAQYLFGFGQVVRIKAVTAKQKALYPAANSVISMNRAVNNTRENVEYLVADQITALAAL